MNIEKRYWNWNPDFNNTDYKIGTSVEQYINKGVLKKIGENEYKGIDENPWKMRVENGKIQSVFFRDEISLFEDVSIWDKQLKDLCEYLDSILIPAEKDSKGKILTVVFREFFVSVVGIIDKG